MSVAKLLIFGLQPILKPTGWIFVPGDPSGSISRFLWKSLSGCFFCILPILFPRNIQLRQQEKKEMYDL